MEPLRRIKKTDPGEMARRYKEARDLLVKVLEACHKPVWEMADRFACLMLEHENLRSGCAGLTEEMGRYMGETVDLAEALKDAIRRPMGVIPESAEKIRHLWEG